jgi:hypothetical protein
MRANLPVGQKAVVARREDAAKLERQVRGLVSDLMRGILRAVAMASPAEIGDVFNDRERASSSLDGARSVAPRARRRVVPEENVRHGERDAALPGLSQDPFAITSPGEILASELSDAGKDRPRSVPHQAESGGSPSEMSPAPQQATLPAILQGAASPSAGDREAESERRPKIVLREGERLLSATGSGVVIRRDRRVSPRR